MKAPRDLDRSGVASFRTKLLIAMMLVVSTVTAVALLFAQRNVAATARRDLERQFRAEVAAMHAAQEIRHAALAERCRALARKPRIHAALEDNAQDLLYPSARDELLDVMSGEGDPEAAAFHARFYRFLDPAGKVIAAAGAGEAGLLDPGEERALSLPAVPTKAEAGYLWRTGPGGRPALDEIIAMPIASTETHEVVSALVLGFRPLVVNADDAGPAIRNGILVDGQLQLPELDDTVRRSLAAEVGGRVSLAAPETSFSFALGGTPHLGFAKLLNPGSPFPPAYEVCLYPLTELLARQRRLLWEFVAAGVVLLAGGFVVSGILSARLSMPVERLAVDSEENRTQRARAEAALGQTHEELQRSARFSADASHQLKTPVTVLRAGLEELLAGEKLAPGLREEVASLVHQTFRLTNVIEDLLLLSRMDAGRLRLDLSPVNLSQLLEGMLDDLGALPNGLDLHVETDLPEALWVDGEAVYTSLILQNLLENARKYNRPHGRIRVLAREEDERAVLRIGNTGRTIAADARGHIFERFHRGAAGENVPGHGLGLNLARELARLHGGELSLLGSENDWTEFEVRFRLARATSLARPPGAA